MHNLAENYKAISLLRPQSIATTTTSTGVTVEQYEGDGMVVVDLGSQAGTTETLDVTVETSTDGTNYTLAKTIAQVDGSTGDNKLAAVSVNLTNVKKIRVVFTKSSTGADLVGAILIVRSSTGSATLNSATPA